MSDDDRYTRITLRLPKDLHAALDRAADGSSKSLNAEIVERLSRTLEGDDAVKLMRSNTVLLRALADFVVLRHEHPDAMGPMEGAMIRLARAVKETRDDENVFEASAPSFHDYAIELTAAVERVTEILGPGWAKPSAS